MKVKIGIYSLCCVFMLTIPGAGFAAAESLSTEELLEYGLESLRTRMDGAVEKNRKLSSKNSSFRKRILLLKKEMRELDDAMIRLKEQTSTVKRDIRTGAQELKMEEKQMNNMLERRRHMEFERDTLKNQMESLALERNLLKESVEEAEFDISELQGDLNAPISSNLLDYYEEEKLKLLDILQDYRKRIDEKRNKLNRYDRKTAARLRDKELVLRRRESFERTFADWQLRLNEEEARGALLNKTARRLEEDMKEKRLSARNSYAERREDIRYLEKVIHDLEASRRTVEQQLDYDEQEMKRFLSLLEEQNNRLFRYYRAVETQQQLVRDKKAQSHTALLLEEQQQGLKDEREKIKEETEQMQDSIVKQRQINESLKRDEQRMHKSVEEASLRLKEAEYSVDAVLEETFGQKRTEAKKMLQDQRKRVEALEAKLASAGKSLKGREKTFEDMTARKDALLQKLEQQFSQEDQAEAAGQELLKKNLELARLQKKNTRVIQQEIQDALMRRQALEASLDVVHKKYSAGEDEAEKFASERVELMRYLDVLKQENLALQKKMQDLEEL